MYGVFGGLLSAVELLGRTILVIIRWLLFLLIGQSAYKFNIDSEANRSLRLGEGALVAGSLIGYGLRWFIDWHELILFALGLVGTFVVTFSLEGIRSALETETAKPTAEDSDAKDK